MNNVKNIINTQLKNIKVDDNLKSKILHNEKSKRIQAIRPVAVMAALCIFIIASTSVFAVNLTQSKINSFYLRYLSPQEMAVADSLAEQYGAKVYFEGLKSDDMYKQYFSINKLIEYYNDDEIRMKAINAITPFLENQEEKLSSAAAFALSILKKEYKDPHILHLADDKLIFTLFNDYSDYGSYNQIWMIKNDELTKIEAYNPPKSYIKQIIPSPDKKLFAVITCSNKSEYIVIYDLENGRVSPELIDSARFMVAKDKDYTVWQRMDFENYSGLITDWIQMEDGSWAEDKKINFQWVDNSIVEFKARLGYNGAEIVENVVVKYDMREKHMEYTYIQ